MAAMGRARDRSGVAIVLVEIAYVTVTAGLYAGLQQRALALRSRLAGNAVIVFGVPWLAQALDWLTHRVTGASAPARATLAMCAYATLSALFHLHVMRRGAFLTGRQGRPLLEDLRRVPRLVAGFGAAPLQMAAALSSRAARTLDVEAA